ncbi:NADPH-dependent F420 reductase [Chitinophaga lutea]
MKIGILGSGPVGLALGHGLVRLGHAIMLGTRDTQKPTLQTWLAESGPNGHLGSFAESAAFGEALFLCTGWTGTRKAIESAGLWNFRKKVVIDVTNPLDGKGPDAEGRLELAPGNSPSGGEQVQAWLQDAHVVKALNTVGNSLMVAPHLKEGIPTMFIAGNDTLAKKAVADLLSQMGWQDVVDIGAIEMSRCLEALCVLWCAYGFRTGSWGHAFRLLRE